MTPKRQGPGSRRPKRRKSRGERKRLIVISIAERKESPLIAELARRLDEEQKKSGMLKPEFAALIGISGSQYRYVRTHEANPTIEALCRMASALDISVYELLEGKELGDRRNLDRWGMSKAFGEVFKAKMDASGLEREEFIKVANISMPQYYLVVRGLVNPTILTAVEIAKRLELTVWQLLGVEPWDGLPKAAVETTAVTAAG